MSEQHDDFVVSDEDDDWDEEFDDENTDFMYLKYMFEGVNDLAGLATALRALAADCERLAADGWYLTEPVNGGWAHMRREPVT